MPKVQLPPDIEVSVEDVLSGVAELDTQTLDAFVEEVLALRARRRATSLAADEATLLQQINEAVPPDVRARYDALDAKRLDGELTPEERTEFLALTNQLELAAAERLRHLMALAALRNVPLLELMDQLGIRAAIRG